MEENPREALFPIFVCLWACSKKRKRSCLLSCLLRWSAGCHHFSHVCVATAAVAATSAQGVSFHPTCIFVQQGFLRPKTMCFVYFNKNVHTAYLPFLLR